MKRDSRRVLTIAAVTTAVVLFAAACGGAGSGTSGKAAPRDATVGFNVRVQTLDPDMAYQAADTSALHLLGGNLFELRKGGEVVPGLAVKATTSGDKLTWSIGLREGLKFSDGSPLRAADVKATLERILGDKANIYAALSGPISAVSAPDDATIEIKLKRPYPSLETVLAEPAFAIFPAGQVNKPRFFDSPVSAGLYKLKSWGGTETLELQANKQYWGPKPVLNTLTFKTLPDANARLAQVTSGQIDLAYGLPPNLFPQITGSAKARFTSLYGINSLVPRNDRPPFNDVRLRKAVSAAVDRKQISETVFNGKVKPLSGFWPSTMTGYDDKIPVTKDVEGAKQALQGSSCENGCSVSLIYNTNIAFESQEALIIQSNLAAIGMKVKLEALDGPTFNKKLFGGDFELALSPQYDYVNIPDGLLTYALLSDGGVQANGSGLKSPAIDKAVEAAIVADKTDQAEALAEINKLFADEAPYTNLTDFATLQGQTTSDDVLSLQSTGLLEVGRKTR